MSGAVIVRSPLAGADSAGAAGRGVAATVRGAAAGVSDLVSPQPANETATTNFKKTNFCQFLLFMLTSQTNSKFASRAKSPACETTHIPRFAIRKKFCRGLPFPCASRHRDSLQPRGQKIPVRHLALRLSG